MEPPEMEEEKSLTILHTITLITCACWSAKLKIKIWS
jgi:hypothetical protein